MIQHDWLERWSRRNAMILAMWADGRSLASIVRAVRSDSPWGRALVVDILSRDYRIITREHKHGIKRIPTRTRKTSPLDLDRLDGKPS
jgi:hypothetical protein